MAKKKTIKNQAKKKSRGSATSTKRGSSRRGSKKGDSGVDPFDDVSIYRGSSKEIRMSNGMTMLHKPRFAKVMPKKLGAAFVIIALFLSPVFAGSMAFKTGVDRAIVAKRSDLAYNPSFKVRFSSLGEQVVKNWFNGGPRLTPVAQGVSWPTTSEIYSGQYEGPSPDYQTDLAIEDRESEDQRADLEGITFFSGEQSSASLSPQFLRKNEDLFPNPYSEKLTYTAMLNRQLVKITIVLTLPDVDNLDELPVLMSAPTIDSLSLAESKIPESMDISTDPGELKDEREAVDHNEAFNDTLNTWAKSWAEGNNTQLKIVTGDTSEKIYRGLGGWKVSDTPRVVWVYRLLERPNQYAVEVEFEVAQETSFSSVLANKQGNDDKPVKRQKNKGLTNTQRMNLLVENYSTGNPRIVAWGPVGSWSRLEPYSNGIEANSNQKRILMEEGNRRERKEKQQDQQQRRQQQMGQSSANDTITTDSNDKRKSGSMIDSSGEEESKEGR